MVSFILDWKESEGERQFLEDWQEDVGCCGVGYDLGDGASHQADDLESML